MTILVVLRGQLENPAPTVLTALNSYRQTPLSPESPSLQPSDRPSPTKVKVFQPNDIKAAATAYGEGSTLKEVAAQFGIHRRTLARHLKQAGVELRYRSMTGAEVDRAAELYAQGLSLARVGDRLGFDTGTVHLALRNRGTQMRDTQGKNRS